MLCLLCWQKKSLSKSALDLISLILHLCPLWVPYGLPSSSNPGHLPTRKKLRLYMINGFTIPRWLTCSNGLPVKCRWSN